MRITLISDFSTQFIKKELSKDLALLNIENTIDERNYNPFEIYFFSEESRKIFKTNDVIILFESTNLLYEKYLLSGEKNKFSDIEFKRIKSYLNEILSKSNIKIILSNYYEFNDKKYGNQSGKFSDSFIYQLRRLNFLLSSFLEDKVNVLLLDILSIQSIFGSKFMLDNSLYTNYGVLFSLEATKIISKNISNIFRSISSKIIKCIIVDLDNTIWGGVIGDDGLSKIQIGNYGIGKSFTLFQKWLKSTKELGIILCVCSKNDERNAKLPFVKHPEMILQLDDITLFVANWEDKDKNIKMIKETLNIDFESIVFIDDNKFERNIVKKSFPEILVPDLPEDPVNYLEFIIQENFLENNINSKNKNILNRTELYKTEFKRIKKKQQFKNNDAFLKELKMKSSIEVLTKFNIPRISELTKRTNQFNLTNKRFEEFELLNISTLENNFSFSFSLNDKFGDYGIVSFIILEKKSPESLQIINWNMSCRVFKRGLEGFIINQLNIYFSKLNFKYIHGKLIPTKKNNILKDFLKIAGIILDDSNQFCIELKKIKINKTFIENE
tara:strand:+ start:638 stop:2302 length:1665 start_codon:yes stop_codon:yes gene_type:complete